MYRTIRFFAQNAQAAFIDIAMGIAIVAVVTHYTDTDVTILSFLLGAWLAILPDHDIVPTILRQKYVTFDHRQTLLHRPFLVLPVVTWVFLVVMGETWALVAFLCVFWHFLHDTNWTGTNYGVAWFWPFSNAYWSWWGSYFPTNLLSHEEFLECYWATPTTTSVISLFLSVGVVICVAWAIEPLLLFVSTVMLLTAIVAWILQ